jgi:hypothetical protein
MSIRMTHSKNGMGHFLSTMHTVFRANLFRQGKQYTASGVAQKIFPVKGAAQDNGEDCALQAQPGRQIQKLTAFHCSAE